MCTKIIFCCLLFTAMYCPRNSNAQQIINGNFEDTSLKLFGSITPPDKTNALLSLALYPANSYIRLVNMVSYSVLFTPDSIYFVSNGFLSHVFFDSSNTWQFRKTNFAPNGYFRDYFEYPSSRTQFKHTPFANNTTLLFTHTGAQYLWDSLGGKDGLFSLKLSINYSSPLLVGKQYLLTWYDLALDSVMAADRFNDYKFQLSKATGTDSLFVGSALNDSTVGDTLAIVHPQRGKWNKRHIYVTPTKPYTQFTIGNYSNEWKEGAWNTNAIDECAIYQVQTTTHKTVYACLGDSLLLKPTNAHKFEWQDGDTIAQRYLNIPGWHVLYKFDTTLNTVTIDSFLLVKIPTLSRILDTTACQQTPIKLSSTLLPNTNIQYVWNTMDTTASITTLLQGWVICKATTQLGCTFTDSFNITRTPAIVINLPQDTLLCYGQTKLLNSKPQPGVRYRWNEKDTLHYITISKAGKYTLIGYNNYCMDSAWVNMVAKGIITLNLPKDTVFCFDNFKQLLLDAGNNYVSYLWQPTGEYTSSIYANMPQKYLVLVKDSSGCDGSASSLVTETCPEFVFIPNAFTPNADGLNDVFLPKTRNLERFEMQIVNQWGQLIFTTTDNTQGWDGKDAPIGTYVVLINYKVTGKIQQSVSGNVTLLR